MKGYMPDYNQEEQKVKTQILAEQTTFFAKLAEVQTKIGIIAKDAKNPHFGNKYVTLDAITKKLIPLAAKCGLVIFQTVEKEDAQMQLVTYVRDAVNPHSQVGITNRYPLSWDATNPQKQGSAITYARRYSLGCIFQIATDEDDDANYATAKNKSQKASPDQISNIKFLVQKTQADLNAILRYYKVDKLESLTSSQAQNVCGILKNRPTPQQADNADKQAEQKNSPIVMPDGKIAH